MSHAEIIARAVEKARKVPVTVGLIVGHDSTDLAGEVRSIVNGIATVDFKQGGVRQLPAAELFDVNLVKRLALEEKFGSKPYI